MDIKMVKDQPELLFEVSWEVCNKVGGIHTVIASKAKVLIESYQDRYIVIGPDTWRGEGQNPEFIEDPGLFRGWKKQAFSDHVQIKTGRWNITGQPIAIIVDYTPLIAQKNEILSKAWENYKLDSLSGQWDYVEAALFGYAAGQVIKSFVEYYRHAPVMAHFHEWMTGMGVLYLKKEAPFVSTAFTTHATVVGRSIAGNNMPLYEKLESYHGDEVSNRLGVRAKHSLEKTAAHVASCFSTVSEITAWECSQFLEKQPDRITPNGFEPSLVPFGSVLSQQRASMRKELIKLAQAVTNNAIKDEVFLIGTSGRYEFRNKGLDVFIDALGKLNSQPKHAKTIVAFVLVPANHYGPRKSVSSRMAGGHDEPTGSRYLSHNLHDESDDPIIRRFHQAGLLNDPQDAVQVIFIPSYLNGTDGVLNHPYYSVLSGLDLTIFPSYYEPWGYTPLESIAFGVPTVTTNYAGFGVWINELEQVKPGAAVRVLDRVMKSEPELIDDIVAHIQDLVAKGSNELEEIRNLAAAIAAKANWVDFIADYRELYRNGIAGNGWQHEPEWETVSNDQLSDPVRQQKTNEPVWKSIVIDSILPEQLSGLNEIAHNLWWTWHYDAEKLFQSIDPDLWAEVEHNPIRLLRQVAYNRLLSLEQDDAFMKHFGQVLDKFHAYLAVEKDLEKPPIAYFSMEYGFHASLKIYSGGLGILAGDYLKEASDRRYPLTGVGLLYRNGYFKQVLSVNGDQMAENLREDFAALPVAPVFDEQGNWQTVVLALPGRKVLVRIWEVAVGRIRLLLLDTDHDENQPADREITANLYGGDEENRLKQEMVLGVGGIRALAQLGIKPDVYHCNEGHAAFIGFERINRLMNLKQFTFNESVEIVRASTLFTTHTPVPAGHDAFHEDLIRTYMGHYPSRMNISWDEFIDLGKMNPGEKHEKFSMSHLAANLSQEINAVSRLHGDVTKNMFAPLWKGYFPEELHVGYVTNGVHYQTWASEAWQALHSRVFGEEYLDNQSNKDYWRKINQVNSQEIWDLRNFERDRLISYIKKRLHRNSIRRHEPPRQSLEVLSRLDPDILTIGFARRFATYKRAHLLFNDTERLARIVNHPDHPVQFLFAGKAHPRDKAGQDLIRYIIQISRRPEFVGRIVFLENYDMTLARHLVQGVDIWLNTPTRPLEASGTSGMKAAMNGVMNFSVLDGWWCEGYREGAGWALPEDRVYHDQGYQDELDALTVYNILEEEIVPMFYNRNQQGVPEAWVGHIKKTLAEIAPEFTTRRMIDDYYHRFYAALGSRSSDMKVGNYHLARELTRWKKKIATHWDQIKVVSIDYSHDLNSPVHLGTKSKATVVLDVDGLSAEDIGVEMVVVKNGPQNQEEFVYAKEFTMVSQTGKLVEYRVSTKPTQPGVFRLGIRVFPKHNQLPNRQDFNYLKWI